MRHAFADAPVLPLRASSRYVLMSDCHRGTGGANDNFLKNRNVFLSALQYYYREGFTYLELGDGDELWENRSMEQIREAHGDIFRLLSRFCGEGRLHMLYGNHDMIKKNPRFQRSFCPDLAFTESLILKDVSLGPVLCLTHGHQTDVWNSSFWKLTRSLVRYLWGPLERLGFSDPTSAAKNYRKKAATEKRIADWAVRHRRILICGHTHRPTMGNAESPYCNTGSCVHPGCITAIEIENRCLTLVKWCVQVCENGFLCVGREALTEAVPVESFFSYVPGS